MSNLSSNRFFRRLYILSIYALIALQVSWIGIQFSLHYLRNGLPGFVPESSKPAHLRQEKAELLALTNFNSSFRDGKLLEYAGYPQRRRFLFECSENFGLTQKTCNRFSKETLDGARLETKNTLEAFKFVKQKITELQFPNESCELQRYTVSTPAPGCGFGCIIHTIAQKLIFSHTNKRVLVLEVPYARSQFHWANWFDTISGCQVYFWNWKIVKALGVSVMEASLQAPNGKDFQSLRKLEHKQLLEHAKKAFEKYSRPPDDRKVSGRQLFRGIERLDKWLQASDDQTKRFFFSLFDLLVEDKELHLQNSYFSTYKLSFDILAARTLVNQKLDLVIYKFWYSVLGQYPFYLRSIITETTHQDPFAWVVGTYSTWIMDLKNKRVRDFIKERKERMNITAPFLASIHVRRTDKYKEAPPRKLADYIVALEKLIAVSNKYEQAISPPYSVFIATDEPDVIKKELPESDIFDFHYDNRSQIMAKHNRRSLEAVDLIFFELEIMFEATFFVGTFSSNYGRLVAEVKNNDQRDALLYSISIDLPWGYY